MKTRFWALSVLAVFLLAAGTVRAQSVDDRIKSLEQELLQLKEQQIELKKEATTAAQAMPSFSYRPGNGLNIESADKSWGVRFTVETHFRYLFESGRDQVGRSNGEMMGRRFRPGVLYCINNCLWEIEATLDLDGFGTGNGKNSTNTGGSSILQRGAVNFHAENLNPWLPTVQFGMEVQNAAGGSLARQGSGNVGAQAEYDLLTRNNGFNTGRAGQGAVLNWDDRSLSGIGYSVGPYTLRAMGSFEESEDRGGQRGKKTAHNFLIGHDLYLWSPKGFLTGSATTPNSILVGTHFERADMSLGCNGSTGIPCTAAGLHIPASALGHLAQFHRNRILLREWDLWYVIAPRMNVGLNVLWYDASNLRNGRNQAAHNLNVCSTGDINNGHCRSGIGGDWLDVMLNWRYTF